MGMTEGEDDTLSDDMMGVPVNSSHWSRNACRVLEVALENPGSNAIGLVFGLEGTGVAVLFRKYANSSSAAWL